MTLLPLLLSAAFASPSFDPATPEATFTGEETWTISGSAQLWSAIERHHDPDALFQAEQYNSATAWPEANPWSPWIAETFGTGEPHSGTFLLHIGVDEATATGTPILFVPGAGDNGSRGFVTMAARMNAAGRPVYAVTFAHPHGDGFQQAEIVADAIARIQARTGAAQVDLVAHSKGGPTIAIYLSNHAGAEWARDDYSTRGTRYRGDVRKAVFIASPLGGVDTTYRWPLGNSMSLSADTAMAPVSWRAYYPYGTATWWISTDTTAQDFLPEDGDLFPGQRQLVAAWDDVYPLPGELPWLGVYALQPDWWTTYYGGVGYVSDSDGIDAAIAAGDDMLPSLERNGVDPDIQVYVLAGENPLMPNGSEQFMATFFDQAWLDLATSGTDLWAALWADAVGDGLVSVGIAEEELQGMAGGKLILGEISGPSDGVVFVDSATKTTTLTARGAQIEETYVANLSHLDLLYASPVTGALLIAAADADPLNDGWQAAVGQRYIDADTLGWVETALVDPADPGGDTGDSEDTGDTEDTGITDTGDPTDPGDGGGTDSPEDEPEGSGSTSSGSSSPSASGCSTAGGTSTTPLWFAALALLIPITRRRRTQIYLS